MSILRQILDSFVFWGAWIIIPILMEIFPSIGSVFILIKRRFQRAGRVEKPAVYPEISIIIPVYNSADTLSACIESIYFARYPNDSIRLFLVNNQGKDESFSVFAECQRRFPELRMQWLNAQQGKSRALNLALYNSEGKYIINLDSDGILERSALTNMVEKFEAHPDLNCMTGAILTSVGKIRTYKGFFSRLLRNLEFMEYAQAFLAGRSYASELNAVYTLSGAFSAFRKSVVLKSWMYNTDTVSEDTHITFQMRYRQKERVEVCEDALFFVDPIESVNKLYTQRQRWQRGSLEVAQMFLDKKLNPFRLLKDVNVKTLLYDHTFAFPRMIWYLALICLMALNYSGSVVIYSTLTIFALYIIVGFLYFFTVAAVLKMDKLLRQYYLSHWWCILILPFFNLAVFFIRMAGIINSINTDSAWKTRDLTEERTAFWDQVKEDARRPLRVLNRFRAVINCEPREKSGKASIAGESVGWYIWVGLLYLLGGFLVFVVYWSKTKFGVSINEIVTTLGGPMEGAAGGMVAETVTGLLLPVLAGVAVFVLLAAADTLIGRRLREGSPKGLARYRRFHGCVAFGGAFLLLGGALYANAEYGLVDYFAAQGTVTTIYEEYYVPPDEVAITAGGEKRNLIYIYVESLETTYASVEDGGHQPVNYMPGLTELAEEYLNFADVDGMGGFHATINTNFTMAALLATTAGIPYAMPVQDSVFAELDDAYMPGLVNLGDILEQNGYVQEFMCGSDSKFAGRRQYFEQHGNYRIFDIYTARERGYVPEDYWHNWGFEDKILFDAAKEELSGLAAEGRPFNFTLLTVDLHAPDGDLCQWCGDQYAGVTANVVSCTDRLVTEFVRWCQKQEFYKDTVIIITGDHPRMDANLVDGLTYYERTVYDCFINCKEQCALDVKSRTFAPMDMFPTILGALGCEIEGNRLGLGTNLFSDAKTLAEQRSFSWLSQEVAKPSNYYVSRFASNASEKMQIETGGDRE